MYQDRRQIGLPKQTQRPRNHTGRTTSSSSSARQATCVSRVNQNDVLLGMCVTEDGHLRRAIIQPSLVCNLAEPRACVRTVSTLSGKQ